MASLWTALRQGRIWLILGGAVLLAVGVVTAVRADQSTVPPIVGGVLVLLGYFGDRVTELLLKHGDTEVRVQLAEVVAKAEDPAVQQALRDMVRLIDERVTEAGREQERKMRDAAAVYG